MDTTEHPSREELSAFSAGRVSAADLTHIAAHLEQCPACCSLLDQLTLVDAFADKLREAPRRAGVFEDAAERRLAAEALAHRRVRAVAADASAEGRGATSPRGQRPHASATTRSSRRSAAAAWASSTRHGRSP